MSLRKKVNVEMNGSEELDSVVPALALVQASM